MKIIHVISYFPPHLGGMEACAKEIAERLARKGHQIEVYTSDIGCKNERLKSAKDFKIRYLKSFEFAHTPIIPNLFFKLLKIPKYSIIHLHLVQSFVPEIVWLVSKIRKVPYIAHVHLDVGPSGKLGSLLPLYKRLFLKRVLSRASKVVCLTEEYEKFINKKYGIIKNKIITIPNGVSEKFLISKKDINSNNINLLFVGRLSIQKNVPRLINAISLLKGKATLHIVGSGEKENEIKKLISDKKLNNVILHGKKVGRDLVNFYKSADIFILPSDREGLPLVLLEAMASGTPIIASSVMGIREFVGDAGILVNPPTPKKFAMAIDELIENKEKRNTLSIRGREKVKQYDWNKIVKKFETVYREVLNENN